MRRVLILVLPALLMFGVGCQSDGGGFSQKVGTVSTAGTAKTKVQRGLGRPDKKQTAVAGATPDDPAPATIQTGARYQRWTYTRDNKRYDVFMGPSADGSGKWEVHEVRTSAAAGAVAGAF